MNLMHSNLQITDGVYGIFSGEAIRNRITRLGEKSDNSNTIKEIEKLLEKLNHK